MSLISSFHECEHVNRIDPLTRDESYYFEEFFGKPEKLRQDSSCTIRFGAKQDQLLKACIKNICKYLKYRQFGNSLCLFYSTCIYRTKRQQEVKMSSRVRKLLVCDVWCSPSVDAQVSQHQFVPVDDDHCLDL